MQHAQAVTEAFRSGYEEMAAIGRRMSSKDLAEVSGLLGDALEDPDLADPDTWKGRLEALDDLLSARGVPAPRAVRH